MCWDVVLEFGVVFGQIGKVVGLFEHLCDLIRMFLNVVGMGLD